ncbi:hypothetical protein VNI00_010641 [Paramarasmius palmivorus]|uniref:DUF6534 domain-containing protein n=1 Tax=Paramarasmius palmivorus TaxID=297713 RepID=A0AAW0BBL5_9AGAR
MAVPTTIDNTLGLLFNVAIITAALYGAGMLQGWIYFRKYNSSDHWSVRLLIGFILVCDTIQEAMICEAVYKYAVTMHDDPLAMTRMVKTILIELFFAGAIGFSVQMFYCYRIYRLSENNIFLAGFVTLLSMVSLGYTIVTLDYSSLGDLIQQQKWATALNVMSAATDIVITIAMIWCLHGKKTGFRKSTDMINRLIIFTFNTGILTSVLSVADVIALNTMPNTFIYMGFFLIRDRFYTNSILVTLNSREYIRGSLGSRSANTSEPQESISLGKFSHGTAHTASRNVSRHVFEESQTSRGLSVRIDKSTLQVGDSAFLGGEDYQSSHKGDDKIGDSPDDSRPFRVV